MVDRAISALSAAWAALAGIVLLIARAIMYRQDHLAEALYVFALTALVVVVIVGVALAVNVTIARTAAAPRIMMHILGAAVILGLITGCSSSTTGSNSITNYDAPVNIDTPVTTSDGGLVISRAVYKDPLLASKHGHWDSGPYCYFADDGLHFDDQRSNKVDIYTCTPAYWPIGDGTVRVEVKQISGDGSQGFGIIFCMQQANGQDAYGYSITSNGMWSFVKWTGINGQDGVPSAIVGWTPSNLIHTGLNVTNTLSLVRSGQAFTFFVNGAVVGQANDSTYNVGYVALYSSWGTHVVYTNLSINTS